MIDEDTVFLDKNGNSYTFSCFKPRLFCLLPSCGALRRQFPDKLRLLLRFFFGYRIFTAYDREKTPVGFCLMKNRIPYLNRFAKKGSVLVAPIYVSEQYRRRGIATAMLRAVSARYPTVFSAIIADNYSSIGSHQHAGFRKIGYLEHHFLAQTVTSRKTDVVIFQKCTAANEKSAT